MTDLARREASIVDDLVGIIDYAGRVLMSASYGSHYQLDKLRGLRLYTDQLIARLEEQTLTQVRSEVVTAAVASEATRYPLGEVLRKAGSFGGTA